MPLTDLPGIRSVISVLLTFKIFEACADFLTPDGLGSCRKRRNFGAHRSLVQSCGCGLTALGSLWLNSFIYIRFCARNTAVEEASRGGWARTSGFLLPKQAD